METNIPTDGWFCKYKFPEYENATLYLRWVCWIMKKEGDDRYTFRMVSEADGGVT